MMIARRGYAPAVLAPAGAVALVAALVTVLVTMLAGCTAAPAPAATPTATASASEQPSETPTAEADPLTTVTTLVARPTALELRDSDGTVVRSLDYMGSVDEALAALEVVFGMPPADEPYRSTNHTPPGVFHRWGGLTIDERFYDEERRKSENLDYLVWPRFAIVFTSAAVGDVQLATQQGFHAGDDWSTVSEDEAYDESIYTCVGTPIDAIEVDAPAGRSSRATVVVAREQSASTVNAILAPQLETDGCA